MISNDLKRFIVWNMFREIPRSSVKFRLTLNMKKPLFIRQITRECWKPSGLYVALRGVDLRTQQVMHRDKAQQFSVGWVADERDAVGRFEQQRLQLADGLARFASHDGRKFGRAFRRDGFGQFGTGDNARRFPVFHHGKTCEGIFFQKLPRVGRFQAVKDHRLKIRDGGDGQLLPALQVARGKEFFELIAVLFQQGVVEIFAGHAAGDGLADERADHQNRHERELMGHLEHDEDAGDRRANDRAQAGAHAHDREGERIFGGHGHEQSAHARQQQTAHAAEEKRRRKNPAASAKTVTQNCCQQFRHQQGAGDLPGQLLVQPGGQVGIAQAEHPQMAGQQEDGGAEAPRRGGTDGRFKPAGNFCGAFLPVAQVQGHFLEENTDETGQRGRHGRQHIRPPSGCGDIVYGKGRLAADDAMDEERADDGSQQDTAEQVAVQVLDDLFQHKGHGGDRRVECRGQTDRRAGRRCPAAGLLRFTGQSRQTGGQAAGDMHAGTFASQTAAAADSQDSADETHPDGAKGDESEVLPESGLGLWNTAARSFFAE